MNVIYFTNIYARNGWKWRLEIFTADVVPLSSPTYVDLGLAVVSDEITWAAKYNKLPIGLSETPSLKLKFNISALEDNTTLQHLRDRLFDQFVQYTFPTLSGISASIDVTDPVTGIVSQVVV